MYSLRFIHFFCYPEVVRLKKKKKNQIHTIKRSKSRYIKEPHHSDSHKSHYRRPTFKHSKTHTNQRLSGIRFTDCDDVSDMNKNKMISGNRAWQRVLRLNGPDIYILSLTRDFALNFQRLSCAGEIYCSRHNFKTLWTDF